MKSDFVKQEHNEMPVEFEAEELSPKVKALVDRFRPLYDYNLLQPMRVKKTSGGLVLPDNNRMDDMARGLVLKAGPGLHKDNGTFVPNPVKEGDVMFHMGTMKPFKVILGGKEFLCAAGRDMAAVCEPGATS